MSHYTHHQYRLRSARENFMDRMLFLEYLAENRPGPQLDIGCSIGNLVNLDPEKIEGMD